jgi:hypothetical protein
MTRQWTEDVPPEKLTAIRAALDAAFHHDEIDDLVLLPGGLSSALVYRIMIRDKAYMMRVVTKVDRLNDPVRHFACMRTAALSGLSPRIIHTDASTAIAITDFIPNEPFAFSRRPRAELLTDLALAVRRLQATAPFPPLVDYLDGVNGLLGEVRSTAVLPPAALAVLDRYAPLPGAYPRLAEDQVSSHNDLNPGNLLWDGERLWIVDWEAAFLNDRFVDPAHACNYYAPTPADETLFVNTWLGRPPTAPERARLFLMQQAVRMFFVAIFMRGCLAEKMERSLSDADLRPRPNGPLPDLLSTPQGRLRYAMGVLCEVDDATRSPRFAESLKIAGAANGALR